MKRKLVECVVFAFIQLVLTTGFSVILTNLWKAYYPKNNVQHQRVEKRHPKESNTFASGSNETVISSTGLKKPTRLSKTKEDFPLIKYVAGLFSQKKVPTSHESIVALSFYCTDCHRKSSDNATSQLNTYYYDVSSSEENSIDNNG
ncbi:MAG: hypothetical protein HZA77_06655 [Candidatus Schekmanbacteria bacterium]|nr:hypothetical protein [Candidatus Schekmanbacteria bacterium]